MLRDCASSMGRVVAAASIARTNTGIITIYQHYLCGSSGGAWPVMPRDAGNKRYRKVKEDRYKKQSDKH